MFLLLQVLCSFSNTIISFLLLKCKFVINIYLAALFLLLVRYVLWEAALHFAIYFSSFAIFCAYDITVFCFCSHQEKCRL